MLRRVLPMRHFKTYIMPSGPSEWLEYPILSQKISDYMKNAIAEVSDGEIVIGLFGYTSKYDRFRDAIRLINAVKQQLRLEMVSDESVG